MSKKSTYKVSPTSTITSIGIALNEFDSIDLCERFYAKSDGYTGNGYTTMTARLIREEDE